MISPSRAAVDLSVVPDSLTWTPNDQDQRPGERVRWIASLDGPPAPTVADEASGFSPADDTSMPRKSRLGKRPAQPECRSTPDGRAHAHQPEQANTS